MASPSMGRLSVALMMAAVVSSASPVQSKTTLVNYFRGWGDLNTMWQEVATAFEKTHPDIKVRIVNVAYGDYFTKLEAMIAAGTSPDMVFMDSSRFPSFARKRLMKDLAPIIASDRSVRLDAFYPEALALGRYKGQLYGLPNDVAIHCMAYNKNLYAQVGLVEPEEDWTHDDLLEMAKRLTRDTNGDGKPETWGLTAYQWEAAIYANGGHIADDPDSPRKSVINSPEAVAAVEWVSNLYNRYRVVGGDFANGKAGMQVVGHWSIPDLTKYAKFKWDVVGLPKFKRRATLNFGSVFMIPSNSRHPKEAWELVKFYSGTTAQTILARGGFGTPALRAVGESEAYLSQRPPENQASFTKALSYAVKRPFTAQWDLMDTILNAEMNKVMTGKTSARAACDKLAIELTKIFARDYAKAR